MKHLLELLVKHQNQRRSLGAWSDDAQRRRIVITPMIRHY